MPLSKSLNVSIVKNHEQEWDLMVDDTYQGLILCMPDGTFNIYIEDEKTFCETEPTNIP